jgi:hypothetical protein
MNSRWSFALALCLSALVFSHADADHHKKKNKDNGAQLEQCTIVKSGGMGCVAPQKLVCQKMKNGQKCCGCVGDKPSGAAKTQTPPPMDYYECRAAVLPQTVANRLISSPEPDEATARTKFLAAIAEERLTLNGPVTCKNLGPGK